MNTLNLKNKIKLYKLHRTILMYLRKTTSKDVKFYTFEISYLSNHIIMVDRIDKHDVRWTAFVSRDSDSEIYELLWKYYEFQN